jgi:hypothetical protein
MMASFSLGAIRHAGRRIPLLLPRHQCEGLRNLLGSLRQAFVEPQSNVTRWGASLNQVDNKINHWECLPGSRRGQESYRLDGLVL